MTVTVTFCSIDNTSMCTGITLLLCVCDRDTLSNCINCPSCLSRCCSTRAIFLSLAHRRTQTYTECVLMPTGCAKRVVPHNNSHIYKIWFVFTMFVFLLLFFFLYAFVVFLLVCRIYTFSKSHYGDNFNDRAKYKWSSFFSIRRNSFSAHNVSPRIKLFASIAQWFSWKQKEKHKIIALFHMQHFKMCNHLKTKIHVTIQIKSALKLLEHICIKIIWKKFARSFHSNLFASNHEWILHDWR